MQTAANRFRRRSKDTAAVDGYRQATLALRARAERRRFRSGRLSLACRLIGAVAILAAYVVFLPRTPVPPGTSARLVSTEIPPMPR